MLRRLLLALGVCMGALTFAAPAAADLSLLGQWGSAGTGNGQFGTAQGIVVANDSLYVSDQNSRVQRFDLSGGFLGMWAVAFVPFQVSADPAGNIYVVQEPASRVDKFTPTGAPIVMWTGAGTPGGVFLEPRGVVAGNNSVYVSDYHNRVARFTTGGVFMSQWGSAGSAPGQFSSPDHMAVDASGNLYVLDKGNSRIQKFDPGGTFLAQWGASNPDGTLNPASVYGSGGIAVSPSGFVYVANFYRFEIQKFTTAGQLVAVYPSPAGGVSFRPSDLAFDASNQMYVIDSGARILKFAESANAPPPPPPAPAPPAPSPPAPLPPPVLGQSVNVTPLAGTVLVKLPGAQSSAFVPLAQARQLPVGSLLDTTHGTVALNTATATAGRTQSGQFQSGVFQILQAPAGRGLTELRLNDPAGACKAGRANAARKLSSRVVNLLHADAQGQFRTRGRFSSATVRGTEWDTADRCDGTLTRVRRGVVVVRDLRRRKSITVRAGKSYLAKAR